MDKRKILREVVKRTYQILNEILNEKEKIWNELFHLDKDILREVYYLPSIKKFKLVTIEKDFYYCQQIDEILVYSLEENWWKLYLEKNREDFSTEEEWKEYAYKEGYFYFMHILQLSADYELKDEIYEYILMNEIENIKKEVENVL
ncbi:MAG: hypothetical protein QW474_00540 [Candidatus Aenigmatarchaeota archaeon]